MVSLAESGAAVIAGRNAVEAQFEGGGCGVGRLGADGQVKADIMGSGSVTVKGRAHCKVNVMGSGTLTCEP